MRRMSMTRSLPSGCWVAWWSAVLLSTKRLPGKIGSPDRFVLGAGDANQMQRYAHSLASWFEPPPTMATPPPTLKSTLSPRTRTTTKSKQRDCQHVVTAIQRWFRSRTNHARPGNRFSQGQSTPREPPTAPCITYPHPTPLTTDDKPDPNHPCKRHTRIGYRNGQPRQAFPHSPAEKKPFLTAIAFPLRALSILVQPRPLKSDRCLQALFAQPIFHWHPSPRFGKLTPSERIQRLDSA